MPGTIESMAEEIRYQIDDLPAYAQYLRSLGEPPQSEKRGENCIFVGAGDSFAAAKAAEHLSGFHARALDPYDLRLRPEFAKGKHLFVISVSGRTTANIEAAKAAEGIAKRITGITSNARSVLAENCDDLIELNFRKTGELTPGTGSFTATLLACYSRVREITVIQDLRRSFEDSVRWSESVELPSEGTTFIVGTGLGYCMAIYGAAKIYEVLGWKSQYQSTEQFNHMELFSLSKRDAVILIPGPGEDERATRLENLLDRNGWSVAEIDFDDRDEIIRSMHIAMRLQVLAWKTALRLGLQDCSFKEKTAHLSISDAMIY